MPLKKMNVFIMQKHCFLAWLCFVLRQGRSHFLSQAVLELTTLAPPPECWDNGWQAVSSIPFSWLSSLCLENAAACAQDPLLLSFLKLPQGRPFYTYSFLDLEIKFLSLWKVSSQFSKSRRALSALEKCLSGSLSRLFLGPCHILLQRLSSCHSLLFSRHSDPFLAFGFRLLKRNGIHHKSFYNSQTEVCFKCASTKQEQHAAWMSYHCC